ncbi:MOSC domain-containing protein [Listeria aquatica]|uniref:MOSC domain-containing protein n=1 Tax=Listeria aquatica TaxID=1494960 RepID=UPI001F4C5664|nr:MOSC domain-containing protein [Listeria aquatica]
MEVALDVDFKEKGSAVADPFLEGVCLMGQVLGLAVGKPKEMDIGRNKTMMTGIGKEQVEGAMLRFAGFDGDASFDLKHHGGLDRSVCIFPKEHYSYFEEKFNRILLPGAFGENLTVSGLLEQDVAIGDVFQVGEVRIQVSEARNPCATIGKYHFMPALFKEVRSTSRTGFLCRTISEGKIQKGDEIVRVRREVDPISVAFCNEKVLHRMGKREELERISQIEPLAARYRDEVLEKLRKMG